MTIEALPPTYRVRTRVVTFDRTLEASSAYLPEAATFATSRPYKSSITETVWHYLGLHVQETIPTHAHPQRHRFIRQVPMLVHYHISILGNPYETRRKYRHTWFKAF